MNLFYIADSNIPSKSANSIQVMQMCRSFGKKGHRTTLVVPRQEKDFSEEEVFAYYGFSKDAFRIRRPSRRFHFMWMTRFARAAVALAEKGGAECLYSRNIKVAVWAAMKRIPVVIEMHYIPASLMDRIGLHFCIRSKYIKKLILITHSLEKHYLQLGVPPQKISVSPDAVDLERFPRPVFFNWDAGKRPRIGYSGHLYQGRGIELILKLAASSPEFDFAIIGGYDHDIRYWRELAGRKNLSNIFFEGHVPFHEVPDKLFSCDILLMPHQKRVSIAGGADISKWTSPMKMFEYMATGRPIIASDLPVLREVLSHEENCLLVTFDDVAKWREAIRRLLGDKHLATRLGMRAREDASSKYTWDLRAEKVTQLLN